MELLQCAVYREVLVSEDHSEATFVTQCGNNTPHQVCLVWLYYTFALSAALAIIYLPSPNQCAYFCHLTLDTLGPGELKGPPAPIWICPGDWRERFLYMLFLTVWYLLEGCVGGALPHCYGTPSPKRLVSDIVAYWFLSVFIIVLIPDVMEFTLNYYELLGKQSIILIICHILTP